MFMLARTALVRDRTSTTVAGVAFGDVLATGEVNGGSIAATNAATVSATVSIGDLIIGLFGESNSGLTVSGVTDNLGNTYTASNAGTLGGTNSGRLFYSRVTTAGALTTVTFAGTASSNNFAGLVAVFAGPFAVSPLDKNPANITTSTGTSNACPATGALAQAVELVIGWGVDNNVSNGFTGMTQGTLAIRASLNENAAMGYAITAGTSTITLTFSSSGSLATVVTGCSTFKHT